MRIEITASGIYGKDGKPVPVGTVLNVKEIPIGWKSRCRVISGGGDKTMVVNPADEEKAALLAQAKELGIEADGRWGVDKLKDAIAEATKDKE